MPEFHPHQPDLTGLLKSVAGEKPLAIILAGHNGAGKSTFWYAKLADDLKIPLVNADRLTLSILPEPSGSPPVLRPWAANLRDSNESWQRLSQATVQAFLKLIMDGQMPFAFETVVSYLKKNEDGTCSSKVEIITALQEAGYAVALLFIGLTSAELSVLRVATRKKQGGHDVPEEKLRQRFPRTQEAIRMAALVADMTLMFDNSGDIREAFKLVRVQAKALVNYDYRDRKCGENKEAVAVASTWLSQVAPRPGLGSEG